MQRAQVITFAHYLLAYYQMLKRDLERMAQVVRIVDVLPLGSGAIAGSTLPLDREFVRERLNFSSISENSMDTIADRDFVLESIYSIAMVMLHMSRFAETDYFFHRSSLLFLYRMSFVP